MTPRQWGVIRVLADHAPEFVPEPEILREVWGDWFDLGNVRVTVWKIRKQLPPGWAIEGSRGTRGKGYRLVES